MSDLLKQELLRARWRRAREPLYLLDPSEPEFATGGLARHLGTERVVRLLILPCDPEAALVEFDEDTWSWWLRDRGDPIVGASARWGMGSDHAPTPEAMVRYRPISEPTTWYRYLALHRHGGLEMGLGGDASGMVEETPYFALIRMVGRIWTALDTYRDVVGRIGDVGPWEVVLAIAGAMDAHLANVGEGWAEPGSFNGYGLTPCEHPAMLTRREIKEWPDTEGARALAFSLGAWIEDSWGRRQRRFLVHQGERAGEFDGRSFRWD